MCVSREAVETEGKVAIVTALDDEAKQTIRRAMLLDDPRTAASRSLRRLVGGGCIPYGSEQHHLPSPFREDLCIHRNCSPTEPHRHPSILARQIRPDAHVAEYPNPA